MQSPAFVAWSGISLSWADRLALSRRPVSPLTVRAPDGAHLAAALALFWTPFEHAVAQANRALARLGLKDRLDIQRTGSQRWISFAGPEGRERAISIFITARTRDGQIAGGAILTTSQMRTAIYVSPVLEAGKVRWVVPATDMPFTADMVNDLFLSEFGDDPVAAGSFAPLSAPVARHERAV
jgi:hypothetical protein